jgi:hypothetical protein
MSRLSRQCGILNISQPYRPPRSVKGIALLYSNLKEDQYVIFRIILNLALDIRDKVVWTILIWLRVPTSGGVLWAQKLTFGFRNVFGNSWVTVDLSRGFIFMQWMSYNLRDITATKKVMWSYWNQCNTDNVCTRIRNVKWIRHVNIGLSLSRRTESTIHSSCCNMSILPAVSIFLAWDQEAEVCIPCGFRGFFWHHKE